MASSEFIVAQVEKQAKIHNEQNQSLVKDLEEYYGLQGLVFMDLAQEDELPQENMTYFIIENGDYNNVQDSEDKFYTENVTITFWNENRQNPVLDRLMLLYFAKKNGLRVVASDNQNIILNGTARVINMFTLTTKRRVMLKGLC